LGTRTNKTKEIITHLIKVGSASMKKLLLPFMILIFTQVHANIQKNKESGYLVGTQNSAVILIHDQRQTPNSSIISFLHKSINKNLDFHTISLQMPTGCNSLKEYRDSFPQSYEIIQNAINFLQNKNIKNIYIFGNGMGARMASAFLYKHNDSSIKGLILANCRNDGGGVLSCARSVQNLDLPILDIWGGQNKEDTKAALERESYISPTYTQIELERANHRFDGYTNQLNGVILQWLERHKRED